MGDRSHAPVRTRGLGCYSVAPYFQVEIPFAIGHTSSLRVNTEKVGCLLRLYLQRALGLKMDAALRWVQSFVTVRKIVA
jgi:hypothetical protein